MLLALFGLLDRFQDLNDLGIFASAVFVRTNLQPSFEVYGDAELHVVSLHSLSHVGFSYDVNMTPFWVY